MGKFARSETFTAASEPQRARAVSGSLRRSGRASCTSPLDSTRVSTLARYVRERATHFGNARVLYYFGSLINPNDYPSSRRYYIRGTKLIVRGAVCYYTAWYSSRRRAAMEIKARRRIHIYMYMKSSRLRLREAEIAEFQPLRGVNYKNRMT